MKCANCNQYTCCCYVPIPGCPLCDFKDGRIAELGREIDSMEKRAIELDRMEEGAPGLHSCTQCLRFGILVCCRDCVDGRARELVRIKDAALNAEDQIAELKLEVATLKALCGYCPIHKAAPGENCLNDGQRACAARRES